MKTRRFLGSAVIATLMGMSFAACGGESNTTSTGGNGGGGGDTLSNGERFAAATCDRVFDCCNTADLAERFNSGPVVDYAGCRIVYRTIWEAAIEPVVEQGESAGRISFNQAAFDTCMQSLGALSCADFSSSSPFCNDVFTPKVAAGKTCFSSLECMDGSCDIPSGAAEGTCIAKPAPVGMGGQCSNDDDCDAGLYCEASACATQKADGEACNNDDQCKAGACIGDEAGAMGKCGKVCEGGGPGSGPIDKALEGIGGPLAIAECGKIFDCCATEEVGTLLFPGTNTETQCLSLYGAFLGFGLAEIHNNSVEGKVAVDQAAMEACIDKYSAMSCQDFAKNTQFDCSDAIKGLVADGVSCTEDAQCVSKYCNEPMQDQGTCVALPGAGAPCVSDCAKGLYCDGTTCVAQKALGSACSSTDECGEGRCTGPMGGTTTCALICDGI